MAHSCLEAQAHTHPTHKMGIIREYYSGWGEPVNIRHALHSLGIVQKHSFGLRVLIQVVEDSDLNSRPMTLKKKSLDLA